jgi:sRNA-binding carbon storage regulator CsrA
VLILIRHPRRHRVAQQDARRSEIEIETIDGPITIHVMGIENGRVQLGIEAPPSCIVLRGELVEARA